MGRRDDPTRPLCDRLSQITDCLVLIAGTQGIDPEIAKSLLGVVERIDVVTVDVVAFELRYHIRKSEPARHPSIVAVLCDVLRRARAPRVISKLPAGS